MASAAEVKLKAAPKETGANMTLAARAGGARTARVDLPRLEVRAVDEGQNTSSGEEIETGEGLERDAELAGRTESYLTGAGGAVPRCCIAERKGSTPGVSIRRAFAQAVRHLYRVASMGWKEGMFGAKPGSSLTTSESFPEGESLPQPWAPSGERNACAAMALEPRIES